MKDCEQLKCALSRLGEARRERCRAGTESRTRPRRSVSLPKDQMFYRMRLPGAQQVSESLQGQAGMSSAASNKGFEDCTVF